MSTGRNIGILAGTVAIVAVAGLGAWNWSNNGQLKLWAEGIRAIDFRNAPVQVFGTACADPQLTSAGVTSIPLKDGSYSLGQYQFELVGDVKYGDVSGHTANGGSDKAVFIGSCTSGGQTSQVLFVYGLDNGAPARLATANLSAGGNSLVQSYDVRDGAIQIKQNQGYPPTLSLLSYALLNGSLSSLGQSGGTPTQQAMQPGNELTNVADAELTGEDQVNYQTFHDRLAPYGQWINHPRWGSVWRPTNVGPNFKPYANGHWENTDEYGTVWVSDYRWGDIPFHYGRWGYDPSYGWLWVPDYTWAPAWVAWREGAGNVGWLPIPPGDYDGEGAYADDWDAWYGYRAWYGDSLSVAMFDGMWSFVPADDLYAPLLASVVIGPSFYAGFIGRTRGWTRFGIYHGHLINRSIDRERFRAAFGHDIPIGARHDFLAHHGFVAGVEVGHRIAISERLNGHGGIVAHAVRGSASLHHGESEYREHAYSRATGTYSHSGGSGTFSRSTGEGAFSRSGGSGTFSRSGSSGTFSRSTSPAGSGTFSRSSGQGVSAGGMGSRPVLGTGNPMMSHPMPQVQSHVTTSSHSCGKSRC
jgi:uncharacterized protein DUF6600